MNIDVWFGVKIQNGKLFFDNREIFDRYVSSIGERKMKLYLKNNKKQRTSKKHDEDSNQNGYYWCIVIPILCDYFGYLSEEMHEAIKYKFLRKGGTDDLPKIGSTAKLNTHEWEMLMEDIRIWALTEYGIKIPLPNEIIN